VYLTARNRSKAEATMQEINASLPPESQSAIKFLECDLTSFDSIKKAAKQFTSEQDRLDVLLNNAGIMACPEGTTKEGYEIQFGTNHVGHALLTKLLLPTLQKTAKTPGVEPGSVRVVNLSSAAEAFAPKPEGIKFDHLKDASSGGIGTWARYGQSKLANIHHARALAARYPELTCVSVHPGGINTNLTSGPIASYGAWLTYPVKMLGWLFLKTVAQGALNQTWATVAPLAKDGREGVKSGTFYFPVGLTGKDSKLAKDEALTEKLWEWTEKELAGAGD